MAVATATRPSLPAAEQPVLREPQDAGGAPAPAQARPARPMLRTVFRIVNRCFMVPAFRLGLGPLLGSPPGGYVMVLKTTGRQSGQPRYAPLNYALLDGNVYCLAGWGRAAHWFANLRANPQVEVLLPGGALAGQAEEVTDPAEARRAMVRIMRNAGFATMFAGHNPLTVTDAQLLEKSGGVPVIRIRPGGPGNGAYDPGGWGWIPGTLIQVAGLIWLLRRLRRRGRRAQPA